MLGPEPRSVEKKRKPYSDFLFSKFGFLGSGNKASEARSVVIYVRAEATKFTPLKNKFYFTLMAPRSSLIVKFVMSQTSLGPQYWIGPG